ncbi:MAG: MFS transporter, partial [Pseudonocardiaceae bacterium]
LLLLAGATQSSLPVVAVLYACQGVLSAFWLPARQRWLYGVVPVDLRHRANAAIGSINGIMSIVGAAGGGLLSAWHPAVAIMAAGGLQALGYLQLLRVPPTETQSVVRTHVSLSSVWTELREGVQAAQHFPLARSVVLIGIAWGLIGGGYNILLAGHVTQGLHGDAATLGLVYVADGLSVIVGTAIAGRITRSRHLAVYAGAYVLQGAAWALTFAASQLALAVGCLIVMRLASGLIIALDMTILLDKVPDKLRGRITSLHMTTYNAVARISLGALSATLTVLSVTTVGLISGIASVTVGIAWWCWSGRHANALYLARDTETGIDNLSMEKK